MRHSLLIASGALALAVWPGEVARAHKPITSPFTFYDDVLPIMAAHCGACHSPDGIAPMSLLSHESAVPWGESMRVELVAGHMPPWASIAPQDQFRDRRRLSARELNVLLTWAAGGTPPGETSKTLEPMAAEWPLGPPHETLALAATELAADTPRTTREFVLPLARFAGRRLSGVDLRPGQASVVRSARLSTRAAGATMEQPVGLWVPGDQPALLPAGAGWHIGGATELVVRIAYRKRWDREREPASDQSIVGLYFGDAGAAEPEVVVFSAPPGQTAETRTVRVAFAEPRRAIAVWPEPAAAGATLRFEVVGPGGARASLATLAPRAGWERRYWMREPLDLTPGSRLELTATWPAGAPLPPPGTALAGIDILPLR
jgi:hypothetical protein